MFMLHPKATLMTLNENALRCTSTVWDFVVLKESRAFIIPQSFTGLNNSVNSYQMHRRLPIFQRSENWMSWKLLSGQKKQNLALDGGKPFHSRYSGLDTRWSQCRNEQNRFGILFDVGTVISMWPTATLVYPCFIDAGDQIVSKTYMTRVESENTRLRHYLARLHRKTLCYSKSEKMLKYKG